MSGQSFALATNFNFSIYVQMTNVLEKNEQKLKLFENFDFKLNKLIIDEQSKKETFFIFAFKRELIDQTTSVTLGDKLH